MAAQSSLDFGAVFAQILMSYTTMLIFSFVMTFAEPSGTATIACFFGIAGRFNFVVVVIVVVILDAIIDVIIVIILYAYTYVHIYTMLYTSTPVMFLFEYQLVLEDAKLPAWLAPQLTVYDIIVLMHRAYPAFMSGCRCILGSLFVDERKVRTSILGALQQKQRYEMYK